MNAENKPKQSSSQASQPSVKQGEIRRDHADRITIKELQNQAEKRPPTPKEPSTPPISKKKPD
jgi:hypothetical protein